MGERPSPKHSVDRIDVMGDYSPKNCRWATSAEQNRNRRDSVTLTHLGITLQIRDWADRLGLSHTTVLGRYYSGKSVASILQPGKLSRKRHTDTPYDS